MNLRDSWDLAAAGIGCVLVPAFATRAPLARTMPSL
jgi:hypothetical protein